MTKFAIGFLVGAMFISISLVHAQQRGEIMIIDMKKRRSRRHVPDVYYT